jgi:hypothetical protein
MSIRDMSTEALIQATLAPSGEPNYYDIGGEIQAAAEEALDIELQARIDAGDPVAVSWRNRQDAEDVRYAYQARRMTGMAEAAAVADIAEGWGWTEDRVRRVVGA